MKYAIALILCALLAGCTQGALYLDTDGADRAAAVDTLKETMSHCPNGTVRYQASASNDGVAWYTARCEVAK